MQTKKEEKKVSTFESCNEGSEVLNLDELMDVQGGDNREPERNCGLGCYLTGIDQTTQTGGNADEDAAGRP